MNCLIANSVLFSLSLSLSIFGLAAENSEDIHIRPELFWEHRIRHSAKKLRSFMHVQCLEESSVVAFRRGAMAGLGILPNQMTLDQGACQFKSNRTHYYVTIKYKHDICSSRLREEGTLMLIKNLVRIIPPNLLKHQNSDDEDMPVMIGSGDSIPEGKSDLGLIDIPFQCEYPKDFVVVPLTYKALADETYTVVSSDNDDMVDTNRGPAKAVLSDDFAMNMFESDVLMRKFQPVMTATPADTLLYAQIKPKTNVFEKAFLHNCYYHSKLGERVLHNQNIYLIKNGCPIDETAMFMQGNNDHERLFRFNLRKIYPGFTNIRCEVRPCSSNGAKQNLPACRSQMTYCLRKPDETSDSELLIIDWPHTLIVTSKPKTQTDQISTEVSAGAPSKQQNTESIDMTIAALQCNCEKKEKVYRNTPNGGQKGFVSIWWALVTALLSFTVGAMLMGCIWKIFNHTATDPIKPALTDIGPKSMVTDVTDA